VEDGSIHEEVADKQEQGATTHETQAAAEVSSSRVKKAGNISKKKRGVNKGTIILAGKSFKMEGEEQNEKETWRNEHYRGQEREEGRGPLAPIRSVMFLDNTGGG
jgi:hypothetical protein